ncbi:MAG TPA: VWA domain-containing protein [Candidatus Angelobacter sp.]|jgi:VWFA-related protein|nr:VWA domain-containing protein [Candidatus Angelobacter sp.]
MVQQIKKLANRQTIGCFVLVILIGFPFGASSQDKQSKAQEPQSSPEITIRTTTRLVLLDIVATDEKGNFVKDLKAEEVQIFENGKEQKKRDFSFQQPDAQQAVEHLQQHLPPNVFTNVPQFKGNSSYNIILLDVLNTSFPNLAYAHDQLIKYLEDSPPNQPTAIYALGTKLWLLHDFTTDHQALKEVIQRFKGQGSRIVIDAPDPAMQYHRKSTFNAPAVLEPREITLNALNSLSEIMAAYRGRKNLIWISESLAVNTMPDMGLTRGPQALSPFGREIERISDAMMEAQIAVYPIDAAGVSLQDHFGRISTMEIMAERTGGKAFVRNNAVDLGIHTSIDDGSTYYTTSYYPVNKTWDGNLRKIDVRTTRPHVKLRFRQGYFAFDQTPKPPTKAEITQASLDFAQALDPDLPVSTGMLFQALVEPPSERMGNKVSVRFAIDPHLVSFTTKEDGLRHAEVSCIAWAFPVKGKPIGGGGKTIKAALDTETFNKLINAALPCNQSLALAPGNYLLRLGVIDQVTHHIGALTAWVTVPDLP